MPSQQCLLTFLSENHRIIVAANIEWCVLARARKWHLIGSVPAVVGKAAVFRG